jgi:hypothetical protein
MLFTQFSLSRFIGALKGSKGPEKGSKWAISALGFWVAATWRCEAFRADIQCAPFGVNSMQFAVQLFCVSFQISIFRGFGGIGL